MKIAIIVATAILAIPGAATAQQATTPLSGPEFAQEVPFATDRPDTNARRIAHARKKHARIKAARKKHARIKAARIKHARLKHKRIKHHRIKHHRIKLARRKAAAGR